MSLRCSACGYESVEAAFFREGQSGKQVQTVCMGCNPVQPRTVAIIGLLSGIVCVGLGVGGLFLAQEGSFPIGAGFYMFVGMLFFGAFPAVVVHETGHALAARAVGFGLDALHFGSGRVVWAGSILGLPVQVGARWDGGGVALLSHPPGASRRAWFLVFAAGTVANLLAAAILALAVIPFAMIARGLIEGTIVFIGLGLIASQLWYAAWALFPNPPQRPLEPPSDGQVLWRLVTGSDAELVGPGPDAVALGSELRRRGMDAEALAAFEAAVTMQPPQWKALAVFADLMGRVRGRDALIDWHEQHAKALGEAPPHAAASLAFLHANVAWMALRTRREALIPFARDLAARAIKVVPGAPPMMATAGAAEWVGGRPVAGLERLMTGMRLIEVATDKAEFCDFIADVGGENAAEFRKLAEHLRAGGQA